MNPLDQQIIDSISSQKLGAPPQAAMPPAGVPPQADPAAQAPQAPQNPKADPAPTNMEKAQAKVAPADQQAEEAKTEIKFIKLGDKEYTENQLSGMVGRYKDLNYKQMQFKPFMGFVEQLISDAKASGYDAKPEEMVALMQDAMKAFLKDPQMNSKGKPDGDDDSGGKKAQPAMSQDPDDEAYSAWEKENAVSLPPGFKESAKSTKEMAAKMDQMMAMFQQIVQGGLAGQKSLQTADQMTQQAQGMQADAATTMITNNLGSAFQAAGLQQDPETRADFRLFAAQRGYDFPDFLDTDLTKTVVQDYLANKNAPEIDRLREVAKKRQAFTGMVEGAPGSAGAAAPAGGDPMLAGLIDTAMSNKFRA